VAEPVPQKRGNRFLDRSTLIATMAYDIGYFALP
jgi:hypothetical protein